MYLLVLYNDMVIMVSIELRKRFRKNKKALITKMERKKVVRLGGFFPRPGNLQS